MHAWLLPAAVFGDFLTAFPCVAYVFLFQLLQAIIEPTTFYKFIAAMYFGVRTTEIMRGTLIIAFPSLAGILQG